VNSLIIIMQLAPRRRPATTHILYL